VLATLALLVAGMFASAGSATAAGADHPAPRATAAFAGIIGGHVTVARGQLVSTRGVPVHAAPSDGQGSPLTWAVLPAAVLLSGLAAYRLGRRGPSVPLLGRTEGRRRQRAPPRAGAPRAA
jgi:hypothetical protein